MVVWHWVWRSRGLHRRAYDGVLQVLGFEARSKGLLLLRTRIKDRSTRELDV